MTRELFVALLTEYGMPKEHAEKLWADKMDDYRHLTSQQVRKCGAMFMAAEQLKRGEAINVPGIQAV